MFFRSISQRLRASSNPLVELQPLPVNPDEAVVVALVPAHNEEDSIAATIQALLDQDRVPERIVVICDNCTDSTYEIAQAFCAYPAVTVVMTVGNAHKKSGALNWAWSNYAQDADILIGLDADTILPPNAVSDWVQEFYDTPGLGGSSSKFTMRGDEFLVRLQRAEFAKWTLSSLKRGWTSVLAGTGCAVRNDLLKQVTARYGREGPWTYDSEVEDFELTYRIRELGYFCQVSPTVRAYTDAMRSLKSLWGQRMKWQVGTVDDLLRLGINRLTLLDWMQQALGLLAALTRAVWVFLLIVAVTPYGQLQPSWYWLLFTGAFVFSDTIAALFIPHRDRKDVLFAVALVPQEMFAWMRAAWFVTAWAEVLRSRVTKVKKDRWELQYAAEGGER